MQGQHSLSRYLKTTWMLRCSSVCNQLCYHPAAAQRALWEEHTTPSPPSLKYRWAMNSTSSVCLSLLLLISFCWLSPPLCVFVGAQTLVWNFWGSCTAGFRHTFPITDYAACGTLVVYACCIYIYPKIQVKVLGSHKTEWASVTYRVPACGMFWWKVLIFACILYRLQNAVSI